MHSTCLLDVMETHNAFWRETVNVNRTFVCVQENSTGQLKTAYQPPHLTLNEQVNKYIHCYY